MDQMIIGRNLINYTIEDFSSEDPNWPSSNLLIFDKRIRWWKTTSTAESYVVIDLAEAKALKAVGVIDVNYSSCKVQGNASDSWGAPSFDTDTVTIAQEKLTDLYRLILDEDDLTGFNYRYLRLLIPNQATTDGAAVFRTGVLAVSVDSEKFLYGSIQSMRMRRNQAISVQEMHGGGQEKAQNGAPYATFPFDVRRLRNAADFTQLTEQFVSIGETELILFSPNDAIIEEANNGQYAFIMRRTTPPEINIGKADDMSVDLREAI